VADKKKKPFVFNDETIKNSYDFRVRNAGIDCTRFDGNSVMLNSHVNTTAMTMGNWENRRVSGSQMLGDSNFDLELPAAAEVAGQVDRGFIKGCSMGLGISFDDDSWEKAPDGVWELTKCELMEVSICAVPSNSNALALYNSATGELIAEDQFKLSLKNLSATEFKNPNTPTMEKITLSSAANSVLVGLGTPNTDNLNATEISNALVKLNADLGAEKTKATDLQAKLDAQVKSQAEALVDGAIADEKLTAGDRADYLELALANFSLASKQIGKLKGKASLSANNSEANAGTVKTKEDFYKLSAEKQLAFKNESPEDYAALWKK
jgi:HK97 family phage prohead protease